LSWIAFIALAVAAAGRTVADWSRRSEQELVAALVERDQEAYLWLVRQHWSGMLRVARSLLRGQGFAEEVVQETWETIYKQIGKFRGEAALKTWMYRILVNRARRVGKREARSIAFSNLGAKDGADQRDPSGDEFTAKCHWRSPVHGWRMLDPQSETMTKEGLAILGRAIEDLPANQRAVVTLRDVEGLGSNEVCELLDISAANQRVLLHRGRTALRKVLEAAETEGRKGAQR